MYSAQSGAAIPTTSSAVLKTAKSLMERIVEVERNEEVERDVEVEKD